MAARSRSTYACRKDRVALKPANVTFEQAGAVELARPDRAAGAADRKDPRRPESADQRRIWRRRDVRAQIAKAFDTEVTAVCSTRNVEIARTLGADHVIDYTKEDFTKREERYDLLFDNVNNHSFSERRRLLKPRRHLRPCRDWQRRIAQGTVGTDRWNFTAAWRSRFVDQKFESYVTSVEPGGPEVP